MQQKYHQPGEESVTHAVDKLQQEVWKWYLVFKSQHNHLKEKQKSVLCVSLIRKCWIWNEKPFSLHGNSSFLVTHLTFFLNSAQFKCCGSNNYSDWRESVWIQAADNKRLVPDSCCKTPSEFCGQRDHPSNIYKVEVGGAVHLALDKCYIIVRL